MAPPQNIPSERDLELLSAYIDGELNDREREALEKRLAQDKTLRATLQSLRDTVTMVRELPRLKAPRSFTLDPSLYGKKTPWWKRLFTFGVALEMSGAIGAAASIALIVMALVLGTSQPASEPQSAASVQPASGATAVGYASESPLMLTASPAVMPAPMIAPQQSNTGPESGFAAQDSSLPNDTPAPQGFAPMPSGLPEESSAPPGMGIASEPQGTLVPQASAEAGILSQSAQDEMSAPAAPQAAAMAPQATATAVQLGAASESMREGSEQPAESAPQANAQTLEEAPQAVPQEKETVSSPSPSAIAAPSSTAMPTTTLHATEMPISTREGGTIAPETGRRSRWDLAGIGLILMLISAGIFIVGYRRVHQT